MTPPIADRRPTLTTDEMRAILRIITGYGDGPYDDGEDEMSRIFRELGLQYPVHAKMIAETYHDVYEEPLPDMPSPHGFKVCSECGRSTTEVPRSWELGCGLSYQQSIIWDLVARQYGSVATFDAIETGLYGFDRGGHGPVNVRKGIHIQVSRIRQMVKPLGYEIQNERGVGYRVVKLETNQQEERDHEDV